MITKDQAAVIGDVIVATGAKRASTTLDCDAKARLIPVTVSRTRLI